MSPCSISASCVSTEPSRLPRAVSNTAAPRSRRWSGMISNRAAGWNRSICALTSGGIGGMDANAVHFAAIQLIERRLHQAEHRLRIGVQLPVQDPPRDGNSELDDVRFGLPPQPLALAKRGRWPRLQSARLLRSGEPPPPAPRRPGPAPCPRGAPFAHAFRPPARVRRSATAGPGIREGPSSRRCMPPPGRCVRLANLTAVFPRHGLEGCASSPESTREVMGCLTPRTARRPRP